LPAVIVTSSQFVASSARVAYSVLADYRGGHARILPRKYFGPLHIEAGGFGAGTRIRFQMRILGIVRETSTEVDEPEPSRVLRERDGQGTVTTFTVEADARGGCNVTIATTLRLSGFGGWLQRWIVPPLLRRIYREELQNLANLAPQLEFIGYYSDVRAAGSAAVQ